MTDAPARPPAAGPLSGMTVIDVSSYLSGPFTGVMLADLGADVIKVEAPAGDPFRRIGRRAAGVSVQFLNTNRNKRGIMLDLKDPADLEILRKLLARADVLLQNWRPGVASRLGLDDDALEALNPRLVHCSITAFGQSGPWAQRGAFDTTLQGLSGIAWQHSRDGRPQLLRTYVVDKTASSLAAQAVLAALLERERTGVGRRVEVNMLDAISYFDFPDMFDGRTVLADESAIDPEDFGGQHTMVATADGWITVVPSTGSQVERACRAAGHPEWVAELKAIDDVSRLAPELRSRLESATSTGSTDQWLKIFDEADVPAAPVYDLDAHLANEQSRHNGAYGELDHPRVGPCRYPRYPDQRMPGREHSRPAPELDEHGAAIRSNLLREV